MGSSSEIYQSVLQKLSTIPVEYLPQVDEYLTHLKSKEKYKKLDAKERARITMSLAGAWSDMSDKEFEELQNYFKEIRSNLFNRNVEL
ncbi:MAG TPA: hypothetical protein ENJ95_16375 [Bacteroidetes bacterium]|nr:hypothetical protein [Bacteroidota bacterium]